jgi:23S rRNA (adenine2503-C2)-methyltransferase
VVTFQEILRDAGVNAHVRKSRGRDIDAACGQLRRKQETLPANDRLPILAPASTD